MRGALIIGIAAAIFATAAARSFQGEQKESKLDEQFERLLSNEKYTGTVDASLTKRLGRPLNPQLVELGRNIFFDKIQALHDDNTCAGCHAPNAGFGDFESIAIGVDNNGIVGPSRAGPRNQRRTPMVLNNGFYPKLMWNGRFFAPSGDPFDNSRGFAFPDPEGKLKFPANDPNIKVLLAAQGHIPGTELPEMAGFTGITGTSFATIRFRATAGGRLKAQGLGFAPNQSPYEVFGAGGQKWVGLKAAGLLAGDDPDFAQFDDGHGTALPPPLPDGTRNDPIRDLIIQRFNGSAPYKVLFAAIYPEVASGKPITFAMIAQALSEFQLSLTFADAPLDRYASVDDHKALTDAQKRGGIVFFGKGNCIACHKVSGTSNEMFSDFQMHNVGTPQIAPKFGKGVGNVAFRNAAGDFKASGNYDFGLEDITGDRLDRFKFRTSPLRNLHLHATFFHNGSFTRLEDAVRFHLNPLGNARSYDPKKAGVAADLQGNTADPTPVLATVDPLMRSPVKLTNREFTDLIDFLKHGLSDPRATPQNLAKLIPTSVPSGRPLQKFETNAIPGHP